MCVQRGFLCLACFLDYVDNILADHGEGRRMVPQARAAQRECGEVEPVPRAKMGRLKVQRESCPNQAAEIWADGGWLFPERQGIRWTAAEKAYFPKSHNFDWRISPRIP